MVLTDKALAVCQAVTDALQPIMHPHFTGSSCEALRD